VDVSGSLLEARELYRFFHAGDEETAALRGVSLRLVAGELIAILGPSGSGKSTLLNCLAGLDEPDGGSVMLLGAKLSRRPEMVKARLRAQAMGVLMQNGNLLAHLAVEANVLLAMRLAHHIDAAWLGELLDRTGLADRRWALPSQLSGGEAARAGLAVALAARPPVLLADEPTAEVDAATEERVLGVIASHCRGGGAALVVTHSRGLARWATRVLHLRDGRIADG
jgi:putative ABC transport system ATP-binding protein